MVPILGRVIGQSGYSLPGGTPGVADTNRSVWHLFPPSIRTTVHQSWVVNSHRLHRLVWNCVPLSTRAMRSYQRDKLSFDKSAILSFPKSGRTFLINTIEYYMGNTAAIEESGRGGSLVRQFVDRGHDVAGGPYQDLAYPRRTKPLVKSNPESRYVFLYRDPRDVCVSYFHHKVPFNKGAWRVGMPSTLKRFVRSKVWGIPKIVAYMRGFERKFGNRDEWLFVAYEDLVTNKVERLERIIRHLFPRHTIDEARVRLAVEENDFSKVRAREIQHKSAVATIDPDRDINEQVRMKARRGVVGGYGDELDASDQRYAERWLKKLRAGSKYYRYGT